MKHELKELGMNAEEYDYNILQYDKYFITLHLATYGHTHIRLITNKDNVAWFKVHSEFDIGATTIFYRWCLQYVIPTLIHFIDNEKVDLLPRSIVPVTPELFQFLFENGKYDAENIFLNEFIETSIKNRQKLIDIHINAPMN